MTVLFASQAWQDYQYWRSADRKTLKRVNQLIEATARSPFEGIGKPERLKFGLNETWTRRISAEHRLVYRLHGDYLQVLQLRYHY